MLDSDKIDSQLLFRTSEFNFDADIYILICAKKGDASKLDKDFHTALLFKLVADEQVIKIPTLIVGMLQLLENIRKALLFDFLQSRAHSEYEYENNFAPMVITADPFRERAESRRFLIKCINRNI